jgi:acetyl-CoA carboxylase carboxyl transferase subunit beta
MRPLTPRAWRDHLEPYSHPLGDDMVLDRLRRGAAGRDPKKIPDGLWVKCPACSKTVFKRLVEERMDTCPECNHHFPMAARNRIASLIDDGTWQEYDADITSADPLSFVDSKPYAERILQSQAKSGLRDAVLCGTGSLSGIPVGLGAMDFSFNGGSMGSVVGEKLTRMIERSTAAPVSRRSSSPPPAARACRKVPCP